MSFIPKIQIGQIVTREEIYTEFKCQQQKGIAHSKSKNALVIISDWTDPKYHDRWDGDTLYYTGAGLHGNQELNLFNNNLKLAESKARGIDLYLFEQFQEKELTYRGRVEVVGSITVEQQKDVDGNMRKAYIFPVQILQEDSGQSILINQRLLTYHKRLEDNSRKMSDKKILDKIQNKNTNKSSKRNVSCTIYERDPNVAEYVKRRAKGCCDLCQQKAPFVNRGGDPYLESHHLLWLANGGDDTITNAVALCPNCHRKMHILNEENDIEKLRERLIAYNQKMNIYMKEVNE